MKFQPHKTAPLLITVAVVLLASAALFIHRAFPRIDAAQRLESITYDWRVRRAFERPSPVATNLAAVFIDNDSLKVFNDQFRYTWPWPRSLHGRLVRELKLQGAKAIGFDVFFIELQPDYAETRVLIPGRGKVSSDDYLGAQLAEAKNVILGVPGETTECNWRALAPADVFRTNAMAIAHATSDRDSDGILRRAKPFKDDPPLGRVWHLGIRMAAAALGLDLAAAKIEPHRITLRAADGTQRVIPLDADGFFYIDWNLAWNDPRLQKFSFEDAIAVAESRARGEAIEPALTDKLVFVGSIGSGNNISDVGASPLSQETYLLSKHWNVANSVLTGRFIRRSPAALDLALIAALAAASFLITTRLRPPWSTVAVLGAGGVFVGLATIAFVQNRFWLPIVLPVGCGLILNHACLVTFQLLFEQRERRRVKNVFSKLVSPNVVNELLSTEQLNLGGSRREITVFFADVRGFTELTDSNAAKADAHVREKQLTGAAAEAYYDEQARETLKTVNTYLATIADQIKLHDGTLDKYIGDCVMAFWGAPTPNARHAVSCVRAAIETQRALHKLNVARADENKKREAENPARVAAGLPTLPPLPLLALGTGINTGVCIVGLMGSDAHILNFTVFGREVNLASRLEGVSGRGRIIIGEATYRDVLRDDPELAAKCVELPAVAVKGIKGQVKIHEVTWRETPATPTPAPAAPAAKS